jgi:hypothetical protein
VRNEVTAAGPTLTAGELRAALAGLSDAVPVLIDGCSATAVVGEDLLVSISAEVGDW